MLGNFTTTAIITKGLHCGPACRGLITTNFSLFCEIGITNSGGGGGGGPYPGPAWNRFDSAQEIYTPVDTGEEQLLIPRNQEADFLRRHTIVTLKLDIGDIHLEKIYKVADKRRGAVIKIFNMLDVTQSRITASITGLKRIAVRAKAFITNVKLK